LDEEQSLQKQGGHTGRIVARILDDDAGINKCEDHLGEKKLLLRTRVTKCIKFDSKIFENLWGTSANLSNLCKKSVTETFK